MCLIPWFPGISVFFPRRIIKLFFLFLFSLLCGGSDDETRRTYFMVLPTGSQQLKSWEKCAILQRSKVRLECVTQILLRSWKPQEAHECCYRVVDVSWWSPAIAPDRLSLWQPGMTTNTFHLPLPPTLSTSGIRLLEFGQAMNASRRGDQG
jgi:hypothetical protein